MTDTPKWEPWAEKVRAGWSTSPEMAECRKCGDRTVARDPEGQPRHAVCPRDMKFIDRRGDRKGPRV